jgi:hypothetical protein
MRIQWTAQNEGTDADGFLLEGEASVAAEGEFLVSMDCPDTDKAVLVTGANCQRRRLCPPVGALVLRRPRGGTAMTTSSTFPRVSAKARAAPVVCIKYSFDSSE